MRPATSFRRLRPPRHEARASPDAPGPTRAHPLPGPELHDAAGADPARRRGFEAALGVSLRLEVPPIEGGAEEALRVFLEGRVEVSRWIL